MDKITMLNSILFNLSYSPPKPIPSPNQAQGISSELTIGFQLKFKNSPLLFGYIRISVFAKLIKPKLFSFTPIDISPDFSTRNIAAEIPAPYLKATRFLPTKPYQNQQQKQASVFYV